MYELSNAPEKALIGGFRVKWACGDQADRLVTKLDRIRGEKTRRTRHNMIMKIVSLRRLVRFAEYRPSGCLHQVCFALAEEINKHSPSTGTFTPRLTSSSSKPKSCKTCQERFQIPTPAPRTDTSFFDSYKSIWMASCPCALEVNLEMVAASVRPPIPQPLQ